MKYEVTGLCVFAATEYLHGTCNTMQRLAFLASGSSHSALFRITNHAGYMHPSVGSYVLCLAHAFNWCANGALGDNGLISVPFITLAILDTSVITVIFIGMMDRSLSIPLATRIKSIMLMENRGPVCKAFVQTGYTYYLSVKEIIELSS